MKAILVGDNDERAIAFQGQLARGGVECSRASILSFEAARTLLQAGQPVDLLFLLAGGEGWPRLTEQVRSLRSIGRAALIAVGHGGEAPQVLQLIRAGAADYLDLAGDLEHDLGALLDRLRVATGGTQRRGQSICVVAASGGCGTSSVVVNLGAALASAAEPCCLIDLQVRGGDLATLLNLRPQHTLVDLCKQGQRVDASMFRQTLLAHPSHLQLLAAPSVLDDYRSIAAHVVSQVCDLARSTFPYVLIDLEDVVHSEQSRSVLDCDHLIVVLRLDFPCLLRTRRMLGHLRDSGVDTAKVRLVANRNGSSAALSPKKVTEALGLPIFHSLPDDQAAMLVAANVGNPVVLESPHAAVSKSFKRLAQLLAST